MDVMKIETKIIISSFTQLNEEDKNLVTRAKEATNGAYAPYSKFYVGCAVALSNGEIFIGSNQENASYPCGICAERVALSGAKTAFPNVNIDTVAIAAKSNNLFTQQPISPCGVCRQSFVEYEMAQKQDIRIIMYSDDYCYIAICAKVLLPLSFSL